MIEPREYMGDPLLKNLKFLGGTENFDLWLRLTISENGVFSEVKTDEYQLRIYRVAGGIPNWDFFKLPLRDNTEMRLSMPPAERGVTGYWGDVELSWDDVVQIETYLKLFAPWVLVEK